MLKITLKDGSVKEYDHALSAIEVAQDLSAGLARVACAAEIDGEAVDLRTVIDHDVTLNILTAKDEAGLSTLRHTASHVMAQAIKRLWPDRLVFTYQGDGDLACIGTAETIHAMNRGENITIIFINNAIYGMTGGQMAPTTLVGQKTATCPYGRDVHLHGYPLKMADIAAGLEGTAYVTRQSVQSVPAIRKAKKAIRKAFENSMAGKGSNLVEIVSTCNSGWKMSPEKANQWMEEHMFPFYPLGDLKDKNS